ncbi:4-hydroxy-tetrahydrodipicolinate reductase [Desulfofalx alkaliphila]|uniref:4-hydroxy-tetrahydrodipicolinate reductase n=1 Tax=Desulfofalx alkaliphila TaxID=105483 RepID=UPI0004E162A7|nr:4-hydroxy-tetrahydrodipicolinate reductase [Desulfofalx alkaliphila]
MIKVVVAGAAGRMGQESCRAILRADGMELVGAVDKNSSGEELEKVIAMDGVELTIQSDLDTTLKETKPDVVVDFTNPNVVFNNAQIALQNKVRPVIGTTGLTGEQIAQLKELAQKQQLGGLIVPNFAIGALLMIKFASIAVKYFPHVEIIELHHDQKMDAPSGTALKTAEVLAEIRGNMRQGLPTEFEKIPGSRGGDFEGMRVHSVRLPGFVAHQEVIFGGTGQTLTIRHDSISRESFMPGLLMGIHKVMEIDHLVYGLENLIFE